MFAGLPELFVILIVIFAAWHVVKAFNRMQRPKPPRQPTRQAQGQTRRQAQGQTQGQTMIEGEDLVNCRVCGSYVAISARHCGRADCPRPR